MFQKERLANPKKRTWTKAKKKKKIKKGGKTYNMLQNRYLESILSPKEYIMTAHIYVVSSESMFHQSTTDRYYTTSEM